MKIAYLAEEPQEKKSTKKEELRKAALLLTYGLRASSKKRAEIILQRELGEDGYQFYQNDYKP